MAVDLGDVTDIRRLLAGARGVLFDFDGPICRLFPENSSKPVADRLRAEVDERGAGHLLTAAERTDKDPHVVLRAVHRAVREQNLPHLRSLVQALEECVTEAELIAAKSAWDTPHADALIRTLAARQVALAVVTNNSPLAAAAYLRDRDLHHCFASVQGRTGDPGLMKPHPDVLHRAMRGLRLGPGDAVMIGDTPTDAAAAARAGVRFIGYGRNTEKRDRLSGAGAGHILGSYAALLEERPESAVPEPGEHVVDPTAGGGDSG